MPEGYSVPQDDEGMLPWSHARRQLVDARNYWIGTVRPDGRPHVTPVWGAWVEERLYFDGSPQTRRGRNLAQNPAAVAHLESGDEVVILEGEARQYHKPPHALTAKIAKAYRAKYAESGYAPQANQWDDGGLYVLTPRVAFAWTKFPDNTTRWHFAVD
jgi:hypothetical protein